MRTYEATIILVQQTERNLALSLQGKICLISLIHKTQNPEIKNLPTAYDFQNRKKTNSKYLVHKEENTNTRTYVSLGRLVKSNPVRLWHKARNGSSREEDWYQNCK